MDGLIRRALLGNAEAQKECTAQGIALPCPCCNGRALILQKYRTYPGMWSAVCGECYICTPWRTSRKEALKDWNTRAKPPIGECGTCKDGQACEFGGVFELEGINGYCPLYKEALDDGA